METVLKLVLAAASNFAVARNTVAFFSLSRVAALLLAFLALMTGVAAIGCAIAALWFALLPLAGPAGAGLAAALALVVLGAIFTAIGYRLIHKAPPPPVTAGLEDLFGMANLAPFIHAHKSELLVGAAVIGLLLGGRSQASTDRRRDPPAD